jgi:hypothetical protein
MASRQEEKQRRREERMARERVEAAAASRRKRMQLAIGGLLGIAAIAGVVLLVVAGLGGGASSSAEGQPTEAEAVAGVTLPEQQTGNLDAAVKAAGCTLQHPPIEGRDHDTKDFTAADYKTNPPTSGTHYPEWYQDGIYEAGDVPNLGMLVHTLEHGRIDVQYKTGTPAKTVQGLETLLSEQEGGYHMLLFENTTNMEYAVAATAWGQLLGCPAMNDKVYDAIRTFRERYIDKGPEQVSYNAGPTRVG